MVSERLVVQTPWVVEARVARVVHLGALLVPNTAPETHRWAELVTQIWVGIVAKKQQHISTFLLENTPNLF